MRNNEIKMVALNDDEMTKVNGGKGIFDSKAMPAETTKERTLGRGVIRRKKARV